MSPIRRTPDPEWFAYLREGDVLDVNGTLRVVRQVSRKADGRFNALYFTIRHPSWTNRAYTVYFANDLKQMRRVRYVGARVKLTREIDAKIRDAINQPNHHPLILTADDVRGVA